jgi:ATP-dependent RNA helicase DeaD
MRAGILSKGHLSLSFDSFNLRPASLAALRTQGITTPTPIQAEAIPAMLEGRDVIAQAQTGSGKTLAFGLPLIERCDSGSLDVQALVLTPTRELAQQVATVLGGLAQPSHLRVAVLYGGVGYDKQTDALEEGAQIVVGTPGRVIDHLQRRTLRIDTVDILVLDEADQMLDQGFARDVERILGATPRSRQTALFSATTPTWVHKVSAKYLREPSFIKVDAASQEPDIEHSVIEVWAGDKLPVLVALLNQPSDGATLVFGRTRRGVVNLARRLNRLGYQVEALQGDLGQTARDRIMARFRAGHLPVLLATNVAARGLDMLNIDRVINYDLPESGELFVHRVGRTGRIGQSGSAVTLITAADLPKMQEIERHLGRKLPRVPVPAFDPWQAPPAPVAAPLQPRVEPTLGPVASIATTDAAKRRRRRRRPSVTADAAQAPASALLPAPAGL